LLYVETRFVTFCGYVFGSKVRSNLGCHTAGQKSSRFFCRKSYLFSDLDEQEEHDDDEEVVENAQCSDDDVDDLEHAVTDVGEPVRRVARFRPGGHRRDVVPNVNPELDVDPFFSPNQTQPNTKLSDPTQPKEVFTPPNSTHHRHLPIKITI